MKNLKLSVILFMLFANYCLADTPISAASSKELYGYKYVKQLPDPVLVKAGMPAMEAMKILGKNTSESIYGGSIFPEDGLGEISQHGRWNVYCIDNDAQLRFLKLVVDFSKKQTIEESYGSPFSANKSSGWLVRKVVYYAYYTEEQAKSIYEKEQAALASAEAAYRERMRKTPKYFKYNRLQNNLYYYALVDQFPDVDKLKTGISAAEALKIIGFNAMGTGGDPDKIAKFDDKSYYCNIGGWVLCKRENGLPYFMRLDVLFLKKRVKGEDYGTCGSPFDYFKCDGWYVGGIKVSYPSEASVKEEFDRNNKKTGN